MSRSAPSVVVVVAAIAAASGAVLEGRWLSGAAPREKVKPALVVLVRHAEKAAEGADPGLTPEGEARARRLAAVLRRAKVEKLISSRFRRTQETLAVLAAEKRLEVTPIQDAADVAKALRALPPGALAVVAHHSFTLREILEALGVPAKEAQAVDTSLDVHDQLVVAAVHPDLETSWALLSY